MNLIELFNRFKEQTISGRYINLDHITPLIERLKQKSDVQIIGQSVLGEPIYSYQKGTGEIRILFWSQMHGNESTTTKALFDLFNLLESETDLANNLLSQFTFYFIPMLNPDGARLYTRENANKVDLNRDSLNLTQPESRLLRSVYEQFKPDYCYNLHDQRTIFGVGTTGKTATVSFLSPSYNENRDINEVRKKAMAIIADMNSGLQEFIPGQIGRFDDGFNINCIGDMFQSLGAPTILFEAGHFPNDYQREETRKYIFISLLLSFESIRNGGADDKKTDEYMRIPQNNPNFYDFVCKNVNLNYDNSKKSINFATQYREELNNNQIDFVAYIARIDDLEDCFGHIEIDGEFELYNDGNQNYPEVGQKANFNIGNRIKAVNGKIELI
ncbi:MAG: M14 metallopeptidase family protein [Flavobacterium sp.]